MFVLTAVIAVILYAYKADAGYAFVATLIGLPLLAAWFAHPPERNPCSVACSNVHECHDNQ